MKQPIIFAIDDDPQVLRAVSRDLKSKYRQDYKILSTESANEALQVLAELKKTGEMVSLFVSDQKMPEMEGVAFLEKAKELYPEAKRILLTAYADTDAAIKAINDVQLDYYLLKPWSPPEEKLYPIIDDLLEDWHANFIPDFFGIKVIGYQFSPKSHFIKDFLSGNLIPYAWFNVDNPKASEILESLQVNNPNFPVVVFENGDFLQNPTIAQIAEKIGLSPKATSNLYDLVIIGAGPAGLAAAVYAGSEGLKSLLIEKRAPGGQAGTSSRIENYLGFPNGLSGADLSRRAITQALRFGVELLAPQEVEKIEIKNGYKTITLKNGDDISTKAVIITTGVDYRKLEAKNIENFTGAGVYYGADTTEALSCQNKDVYLVGGGNSAGQAAMYLSKFARNVFIVIRREDLTSTMSSYLIDQIKQTNNISVLPFTEIIEVEGHEQLSQVVLKNTKDSSTKTAEAAALFIFIGAKPITDWLATSVLKNKNGYLLTGNDLKLQENFKKFWKLTRDPYLLESCVPGIFAAGDVRSGAMNRVASAVGEGAMAVSFVHKYLAEN